MALSMGLNRHTCQRCLLASNWPLGCKRLGERSSQPFYFGLFSGGSLWYYRFIIQYTSFSDASLISTPPNDPEAKRRTFSTRSMLRTLAHDLIELSVLSYNGL